MEREVLSTPTSICSSCGFAVTPVVVADIPDPASTSQDFQALQRCNNPPLQSAADTLSRQYTEAKACLASIDTKILLLSNKFTSLQEERDRVHQYVEQYKTVLHPIRRLPVETLTNIFLMSLDSSCIKLPIGLVTPDWRIDSMRLPWILTQVCRRWRAIATSTPALWTDVRLNLSTQSVIRMNLAGSVQFTTLQQHTTHLSSKLSLLFSQLHYSGNRPITLCLWSNSIFGIEDQLLTAVCSTSQRWKTLRLNLAPNVVQMLSSVRGSLPSLQTLHINLNSGDATRVVDVFERAQALRDLILSGSGNYLVALSHYKLPWRQIYRLCCQWHDFMNPNLPTQYRLPDNHFHLQILSRMPNLVSCFMDSVQWAPHMPNLQLSVQILSLHTLSLQSGRTGTLPNFTGQPNFAQIIHDIHAPALRQLQLRGEITQRDISMLVDLNFHSRYPYLDTLILMDFEVLSWSIIALLSSLPSSVQHFFIKSASGLDDTVIGAFRYNPEANTPPILPKLQLLSLGGKKNCSNDVLMDMLESRVNTHSNTSLLEVSSLRVLSLIGSTGYEPVLADSRMIRLQSEGFCVHTTLAR